ncbi:MAG TPA: TldD/PmbA family protein [Candidatus Aerophobetes bacterium]|uniref:TldD/PmbA family protein n=1 Tax=Aerophobetes bacterium TaxID=2030807 RepID=A0A7V0MZA2_UNCAE|nr:TldD/PmbA family protein [Candidatus Aerophobetes bacterium]
MRSYFLSVLEKIHAEYAEIRYEEVIFTHLHFVGKELESIETSIEKGGNVRVKGKAGWSFISFNKIDNLSSYLTEAIKKASLPRGDPIKLAPVLPQVKTVAATFKKDPRKITLEEKYHLCSRYNRILLSAPEVQTSDLKYTDSHIMKYFANSEGAYIQQERFHIALGMTSVARRGDNIQSAHEGVGGVGGYELVENQEEKAERAAKRASELLDAEPLPGGKYTVVIDPKLSGVFAHEAFGHLSEADFVYENEKLLEIMRIGRRFGSEILNIIDDPTIPGEGGSYLYDDEGVPSRKTYLIREGKLTGRLHSRETAAKMGENPTGNARAISYEYPPIVRMSNTYIAPGEKSKEEIISEVKDGIYACGFRGGQTNLEMFTFAPEEGYKIKNGKLTTKIRDFNLTGNIFTILSKIDAVGDDLILFTGPGGCGKNGQSPLPVSTGGPHIRIKNLLVGGK